MGKGTNRAYKVVPVDEDEPDFGDPPRSWGRVASMTGVWAVVLLAGAWMAPGFASSGDEDEVPAKEQPATDPNGAARRYLLAGATEDLEYAEGVLCSGADPEVSPSDLDQLRQSYSDELGGITRVDVSTEDPIMGADGSIVDATVFFISDGNQPQEYFTVTVHNQDGEFCVSEVVEGEPEGAVETGNDWQTATDYLNLVFVSRQLDEAIAMHCQDFEGPDLDQLDLAISTWEKQNTLMDRYLEPGDTEGTETAGGVVFEYGVFFDGQSKDETFPFEVTISDGCVSALEGGAELLALLED